MTSIVAFKHTIRKILIDTYHFFTGSSSQYGEDLILDKKLSNKKNGFFIDIGANHPIKFSNTFRFYKKGWVGINVEPDPDLFEKFHKSRPRDINLNVGVGPINGVMPFYQMSADTLSTFNKNAADAAVRDGHSLCATLNIPIVRLDTLISEYRPCGNIDFMSVDVEGFEMEVLKSNDWNKFRPQLLIVEIDKGGEDIKKFLESVKYSAVFDNGTNCIFTDNKTNLK